MNETATPVTEGIQPEGSEIETTPQVETNDEAPAEQAPQLTDEDYKLNFLGTDKFELDKQTPEEVRQALKNLEKSLNKGWTEKNMRFSEERKQFQEQLTAAQQELVQQTEAQKVTIKDLARVEALQSQLNEYDQVDWQRWSQTDPQAANSAFMAFQGLQRQHAKLTGEVSQKQEQERQRQNQQQAEWLRQSAERLRENITDWDHTKGQQIGKFVAETYLTTKNTQMDQGALQAVAWHPGLMQMAYEASLYRESMKKATEQPKSTPAVPVTKVGGAAPVAKDPAKLSTKEWMEWRDQDLARKRANPTRNQIKYR